MSAIYPKAVRTFVEHQDDVEIVDASHVNALQDEVTAIEGTLGAQPQIYAPTGHAPTAYATVGARLDAHEAEMATQQSQINSILTASADGWETPAVSVIGYSNPAERVSTTLGFIDLGPSNVSWTGVLVDIGDMYVPNANIITLPRGGLWLFRASLTVNVDWSTLNETQTVFNRIGANPTPLAYQRVGLGMWVGATCVDYEYGRVNWVPPAQQPTNPPEQFNIPVGWFGTAASGTQMKITTDQWYGHVTGAYVTFSAYFQRSVPGVD